jgi:hypothetical protein
MYGCMDGCKYVCMYVCMYGWMDVCVHTLSEHAYTYSYESRLRNNWQISSDMHFVCPDFTFRHECISQAGAVSSAPGIMPSGRTLGAMVTSSTHTMAPRAMVCVRAYAPQVGTSAVSSSFSSLRPSTVERHELWVSIRGSARGRAERLDRCSQCPASLL